MNTRPRLTRSIPFWLLVVGSLASVGVGAYVLTTNIGTMVSTLTDGTATGVEVYAGQVWGVLGAILIGAGLIGLALALTLGALRAFAVSPAVTAESSPWGDSAESAAPFAATPVASTPVASAPAASEASATAAATEAAEPAEAAAPVASTPTAGPVEAAPTGTAAPAADADDSTTSR